MSQRTRLCRAVRRAAMSEPLESRRLLSAMMLKDVNATPMGSSPAGFTEFNGALYFNAQDNTGSELYRSAGTAGGATVVKPGVSARNLTAAGDGLYFIGPDSALWRTDGTASGTSVVSSVPGPVPENNGEQMVPFKGTLYFTAGDIGGKALWKAGAPGSAPTLVADPPPGPDGVDPQILDLLVMGDTLYFITGGDLFTRKLLWKTDGTPQGTALVGDLPDTGALPSHLTRLDESHFTFLARGLELWVTDGTPTGAQELKEFRVLNYPQDDPDDFVNVAGGKTFFVADDHPLGEPGPYGRELWVTDGTPAGTHVLDIRPGQEGSLVDVLGALGDKVLFNATDGGAGGQGVRGGLWASDGTPDGTQFIALGGANFPAFSGGVMYFVTNGALMKTDGTAAGTAVVRNFLTQPISKLAPFHGGVAFELNDGVHGAEPWFSDGTSEGTVPLGDLNTQTPSSQPFATAPIVPVGNLVVFPAIDGSRGGPAPDQTSSLWASDGTPAGARRITPFAYVNATPSNFTIQPGGRYAYVFTPVRKMWRTDGTDAGTAIIKEVEFYLPTSGVSAGRSAVLPNGTFLFAGSDREGYGWEPWKSDGTTAGTLQLKDIAGGGGHSYPGDFTVVGDVAYFTTGGTGSAATPASALWKTDGTPNGTVLVRNFRTAEGSRGLGNLTNVNGTLFFRAADMNNRAQLWKSDGTTEGTVMVKQFGNGGSPAALIPMAALNGEVYFSAAPLDSAGDVELWKSDGTETGTQLVKDIRPGAEGSVPNTLRAVNGRLAFSADDGEAGVELWLSDGTKDGTVRVDLSPGPEGSGPRMWSVLNGRLYFDASDGAHGSELWSTDGTPNGTFMVEDVRPGPGGSAPSFPAAAGDKVVFWGNDGVHGTEPWVVVDPLPPAALAAHVFYNNSAFDGGLVAADAQDDAAIDATKHPLPASGAASFANVTSYVKGLNGVMLDVPALPAGATITSEDFLFRARYSDGNWQGGPPPIIVSLRRGAGVNGTDRVTLVWKDYNPADLSPVAQAVANGWLEVTVKANADTGLAAPAAFTFGNLVGDTGTSPLVVNAIDLGQVRAHQLETATVTSPYDMNRDGRINAIDLGIVRANQLHRLNPSSPPTVTLTASGALLILRRVTKELLG